MDKKLFSKKYLNIITFVLICLAEPVLPQVTITSEIAECLSGLPFQAPKIELPSFGKAEYIITAYGAAADGITVNTNAINNAITKCSEAGGGRVIIPAGYWLTGPIELKNNVNLYLDKGALVVFSSRHELFPVTGTSGKGFEVKPPISGSNLENIAITGEGIFEGSGDTWRPVKKNKLTDGQWKALVRSGGVVSKDGSMWWPGRAASEAEEFLKQKNKKDLTREDYEALRDFYRPNLLQLEHCKKILLDGFTLKNSPKFAMSLKNCQNVVLRKLIVNNEWWAQNGDGLDISACKDVIYTRCTVTAGDDAICMKSSSSKESSKPALENIVIKDCIVYNGHGGFVIGSNTDGGMKNISVRNCTFIGTDTGLRFKSGPGKGGLVEDVFIDGIYMKDIAREAVIFEYTYDDAGAVKMKDSKKTESKTPEFRNIKINNVICDGAEKAMLAEAVESSILKNVSITNSYFRAVSGYSCSYSEGIKFENIRAEIKSGPIFNFVQSNNISLKNIIFSSGELFLSVSGEKSSGIVVEGTDVKKAGKDYSYSNGAEKKSVTIK